MSTAAVMNDGKVVSADHVMNASEVVTARMAAAAVMTTAEWPPEATALYANALASLDWLPEKSIMSTFATNTSSLMGHGGISASLLGLFQRMRNDCGNRDANGMVFFEREHVVYTAVSNARTTMSGHQAGRARAHACR
jgi:hypothetical protein